MGYCVIDDIRDEGFAACDFSDRRVQKAIDRATRFIDAITGQFFEPRNRTYDLDWRGSPDLLFRVPLIDLTDVNFVNTDGSLGSFLSINDDIIQFNRHVRQGLLDPDDRQSPKIAWNFLRPNLIVPRTRVRLVQDILTRRNQNVRFVGRFGFTDPSQTVGRAIATDAGDAITAPDTIKMINAKFTEADVRGFVTLAGAANGANNNQFVIAERISADTIRVEEQTLVTEASGFTATIPNFPQSGVTPPMIGDACMMLVARKFLVKEADVDPTTPQGARILKKSVRDMSITYQQDIRVTRGDAQFTGDPEIDLILAQFMRPLQVEAV